MTPGTAVEFLIWLLIAASIIAVLAERLRIPYTVSGDCCSAQCGYQYSLRFLQVIALTG